MWFVGRNINKCINTLSPFYVSSTKNRPVNNTKRVNTQKGAYIKILLLFMFSFHFSSLFFSFHNFFSSVKYVVKIFFSTLIYINKSSNSKKKH